jgi:hypothetical protein
MYAGMLDHKQRAGAEEDKALPKIPHGKHEIVMDKLSFPAEYAHLSSSLSLFAFSLCLFFFLSLFSHPSFCFQLVSFPQVGWLFS